MLTVLLRRRSHTFVLLLMGGNLFAAQGTTLKLRLARVSKAVIELAALTHAKVCRSCAKSVNDSARPMLRRSQVRLREFIPRRGIVCYHSKTVWAVHKSLWGHFELFPRWLFEKWINASLTNYANVQELKSPPATVFCSQQKVMRGAGCSENSTHFCNGPSARAQASARAT